MTESIPLLKTNSSPARQNVPILLVSSARDGGWKEVENLIALRITSYHDLVQCDDHGRTVLHYACQREIGKDATKTARKILDTVHHLNIGEDDLARFVDKADENQQSAIHIAAEQKNKSLVRLLISRGADVNLPKNGGKKEAIRIIYRNMPKVMYELFDTHLKFKEDEDDPSADMWTVLYDFTPVTGVLPHDDQGKNTEINLLESQTFLLSTALHEKKLTRSEVLLHPLVQLFMHYKHEKFKGWIRFSIICHILWYFLSMSVLLLHFPDVKSGISSSVSNLSANHNIALPESEAELDKEEDVFRAELFVPYALFFFITLFKEIVEVCSSPNTKYYLTQLENWGQWILLIALLASLVLSGGESDGRKYAATTFTTIGIFTSGLLIMGQFNKTKSLGIYMEMLSKVMKNIAKFSLFFSSLIWIYAVIFPLLMPDREEFGFPWAPKIVAMLTGEIEYNGVFHEDDSATTVPYPLLTKFVFFVFAVTVIIVLQNLLIGLTLSDIQELKQKATQNHLAKQLEQIYLVENCLLLSPVKTIFVKLGMHNYLMSLMVEPKGEQRLEDEIVTKIDLSETLRDVMDVNKQPKRFEVVRNATSTTSVPES